MKQNLLLSLLLLWSCTPAMAQAINSAPGLNVILEIEPSKTDAQITSADTPHFVAYNPSNNNGTLFLFLPGTNGIALKGPKDLFYTAIEQGYAVINLSYVNTPAVAQICRGDVLAENSKCTEEFRTRRLYGTNEFSLIADEAHDAITNRLTKLLMYLSEHDEQGNWDRYLENSHPKWKQIAVAGQSQGGGMAAFIAKDHVVARVVDFSGGWDYSAKNKIADWYSKSSKTPVERWYATYHVKEPFAPEIVKTYKALNIPETHIYALDLAVPEGKKAHSNGVRNLGYKETWKMLVGRGN